MHPSITIRPTRNGTETVIEVDGWPGHGYGGWRVYTPGRTPKDARNAAVWDARDLAATARRLRDYLGVSSGARKGRVITAYGWHRFQSKVAVAELLLHVDGHRPLQIQRFNASTELIERDRYAVRSFLVSCAVDIARELQVTAGIDLGWLDWRVDQKHAADVLATAPGFVIDHARARRRNKGTWVILRRRD